MTTMNHLIADAVVLGGGNLCAAGHAWEMDGARGCPLEAENCSQPVYRCYRCGEYDYGEPGGPAFSDCQYCRYEYLVSEDQS